MSGTATASARRATDELAKDCAAFSSAGGGVLVCGISDNHLGVAAQLTPIPVPAANLQEWVAQAIAAKTSPKLPDVRVRVVAQPGAPSRCVVLVLVPPSALAPHALIPNRERLGYPMRRTTTTDWMSETEVAERYRSRFTLAVAQISRADEMHRVGQRALNRAGTAWVTVTLLPALPGARQMSAELVRGVESTADSWQQETLRLTWPDVKEPPQTLHGRVRRQRVVLTTMPYQLLSNVQHAECYLDGGGFAGHAVGSLQGPAASPWLAVNQCDVEVAVLNLLDLLVRHAVDSGASGDAAVLASLLPAWTDEALDLIVGTPDVARVGVADAHRVERLPLLVGPASRNPDQLTVEQARRTDTEPATWTVPLVNVSTHPPELVAAAALLTANLLADDGVSDLHLLSRNGEVDQYAAGSQAVDQVRHWAQQRGVSLQPT